MVQAVVKEVCQYDAIGCFAFTEEKAGVYSGMIIEATVDMESKKAAGKVILNTPPNGVKAWISLAAAKGLKWIIFFGKNQDGFLVPVLVNYLEHKKNIKITPMCVACLPSGAVRLIVLLD